MKWFLFAFVFCSLLFELSQQQSLTCADCPPTASCTLIPPSLFNPISVFCDGLCVSCARYIVYPCSSCPDSGYFCYYINGQIQCLSCSSYPSFCAGPYVYGSLDVLINYASNSSNIQSKPNAIT
uniref:Uncharacterized protein n=1 Tax=Panagrolaimus sp. PS1159 TaxID=55785 RepID=A0AC35F1J8_9BILA